MLINRPAKPRTHLCQFSKILIAHAVSLTFLTACSNGGTSNSGLSVSGTLNSISTQSFNKVIPFEFSMESTGLPLSSLTSALALTSYTVVCATLSTQPVSASAAVNADGTFSLNIPGGLNQPLSCYMTDATGAKAADFLISDSGDKDLNGNNSVTTTATFTASAALGNINFNPNSGEVTVPIGNIASHLSSSAPAATGVFDPTGSWTIGGVDFTLPTGVRGPCTSAENASNSCNGPPDSQVLYLKMWQGTKTATNTNVYALQLWNREDGGDPQTAFSTCGSKIGLTSSMKTSLGVDFSSNGAADNVFSMSTTVNSFNDQADSNPNETVTLTNGWQMDVAKTMFQMQTGCASKTVTVGGVAYNGWFCGPDNVNHYQLGLAGGCVNSSNVPVNVTNWNGITVNANGTGGNPSWGVSTVDANLIQTSSLSGYYSGSAVTCTNKWTITDSTGTPLGTQQSPATFDWTSFQAGQSTIGSGTACSTLANSGSSNAAKIMQLQCYSQYYYQSGLEHDGDVCIPKIQTDWTQTDPTQFVHVDFRPSSLVFMEEYKPFPDGSGGSMLTRQEEYRGIQVNTSWVNCHVIDTGGVTMKKVSDNKILATYQSSVVTTSRDIPACVANFNGTRTTFVFYLTK